MDWCQNILARVVRNLTDFKCLSKVNYKLNKLC